ncbi:MAG: DUF2181 domain-containing protein [Bacteroidota bacterium]
MKRKFILLFLGILLFGILSFFLFFSDNFLKLLFNQKIWVHRVNSIEKLDELKADYYGVELDVVFVDSLKKFDINHPPEKSIQLFLEEYLSSVSQNKTLHFWLDFKNLEAKNQEQAIKNLNFICDSLSLLRNNFIVESSNVSMLNEFLKEGYQISYYLHWPGLYSLNKNEFKQKLNSINEELKIYKYKNYLSSDYRDYEILKKQFPEHEILLWLDDAFGKQDKFKDRLLLYKMLLDKDVKVILIRYKSKINER